MKILVNGCSHIEGTGLDSYREETNKMTWPNLVWSDHDITNMANAGSSNDNICRRTIAELEQRQYDLICVQWSIIERIEVQVPFHQRHGLQQARLCLHSNNAFVTTPLNGNGKFMRSLARSIFLSQFDHEWLVDYSLSQMIVLENYLKFVQVPYVFVMTDHPDDIDWQSGRAKLIDRNRVIDMSWLDFCRRGQFDLVDDSHYGKKAHDAFAQYVREQLAQKHMGGSLRGVS